MTKAEEMIYNYKNNIKPEPKLFVTKQENKLAIIGATAIGVIIGLIIGKVLYD